MIVILKHVFIRSLTIVTCSKFIQFCFQFIYSGIPFLNSEQESALKNYLDAQEHIVGLDRWDHRARNFDSKFGFLFRKPASEFRFPWLFLGFLPEDPSLRFSIYLTIPGFSIANPTEKLGFPHHFWVSRTSGNPVISSPRPFKFHPTKLKLSVITYYPLTALTRSY